MIFRVALGFSGGIERVVLVPAASAGEAIEEVRQIAAAYDPVEEGAVRAIRYVGPAWAPKEGTPA